MCDKARAQGWTAPARADVRGDVAAGAGRGCQYHPWESEGPQGPSGKLGPQQRVQLALAVTCSVWPLALGGCGQPWPVHP